jgi:hypothetical protein
MMSIGRSIAPDAAGVPRKSPKRAHGPIPVDRRPDGAVLPEEQFLNMLCVERKRS